MSQSSKKFEKPPLTVSEQVDLLESRGLVFQDKDIAEHFLLHCNYYRFSGYALHFEIFKNGERTHLFQSDTTFDTVKSLYEFDDKLRSILFDYIGHIEISIRSTMCNIIALRTQNPHWYLDSDLFCARFHKKGRDGYSDYMNFLRTVKDGCSRSKEVFMSSYRTKYNVPKQPPSWMMIEVLTMGNWSKLYENLDNIEYKKEIAALFGLHQKVFTSWIRALSVLRNHCAHHSRIWNKNFHISPIVPNNIKQELTEYGTDDEKYTHLLSFLIALNTLLNVLNRKEQFQNEMKILFREYSDVPLDRMGLNKDVLHLLGYR